jgi:hypothetical protein
MTPLLTISQHFHCDGLNSQDNRMVRKEHNYETIMSAPIRRVGEPILRGGQHPGGDGHE